MTKKEFIQQCCIHGINVAVESNVYTLFSKAEAMAERLEEEGYAFDDEDSIVNI